MSLKEFVPLHKVPDNQIGDIHAPQVQQQVMIQGRVVLERSAFVGHSFSDEDHDVIEFFKALLSELGVRISTGERAEANSVSQKVKDRIAQCDLFVGILTRRERIDHSDRWRTSDWLIEEKTHAAALGKKVILLKERGVEYKGGLQGDEEYVEFDRERLHGSAIKLIQMIWSLNPGKIAFNKSGPPQMSLDILEAAVATQPREPMLRVQLAQVRLQSGQIDAGLRDLEQVLRTFPNFAPVKLEFAKALQGTGRFSEAEAQLRDLLAVSPFDANAHHQLAHVLENTGNVDGALQEFRRAQDCEPGQAKHFLCEAKLMFRDAGQDRKRLVASRKAFDVAIGLGDAHVEKDASGFVQAIARKLASPPVGRAKAKQKVKTRR